MSGEKDGRQESTFHGLTLNWILNVTIVTYIYILISILSRRNRLIIANVTGAYKIL